MKLFISYGAPIAVYTCDPTNFPNWPTLTDVPTNITVGGLVRGNETLIAMEKCCSPNPVQSTGEDDCALWCEIPNDTTGMEWKDCAFEYAPNLKVVTYRDASSAATTMRPTVTSVAVAVMLILGLYSW
ncbi:hypothetical protein GGR58DRAFT_518939 [Xylaria digitata]|nr:hypothetical protein GGR58DRAFT_518939 [Xylaria digitata]